jgi:hypothetical protein
MMILFAERKQASEKEFDVLLEDMEGNIKILSPPWFTAFRRGRWELYVVRHSPTTTFLMSGTRKQARQPRGPHN